MTALDQLSILALKRFKEKHPSVPNHCLPIFRHKDNTANELTKAITTFLELEGCYVTRINSQGQYNVKLKRFTKGTTKRGTADIHAIIKGKHLSVEVKIGKDRMSEHQKKAQSEIEKAGGLYFVAKDFQSFHDYYLTITQ